MAVALVGSAGGNGLNTTINFSYTVGSGTNRLLMLGAWSASTINSASYNSVSMTAVGSVGSAKAFALVAPASGSNTVSVTLSAYNGLRWRADDYTDVDQTTPTGTAVTNTGSSSNAPTTGSVTVPANGIAWGFTHHNYSTALTASAGTLVGASTAFGSSWAVSNRTTTGPLSWTASSGGVWDAIGVPINAAAVPAAVTGNFDIADLVHSGTFATGALSQLAGGITLDDFLNSGFLGLAPGRVDTAPFKNWSGTLLPGVTVPNVVFLKLDRSKPLDLANQTTAGDGVMTITNAALTPGTYYIMVSFDATGANIGAELVLAA